MKATREQFEKLWTDLGCRGDALPVFADIEAAYSAGRRRYHTLEHIGWGLKRIDEMAADDATRGSKFFAEDWNLIRWAFWFHDYVLDGSPRGEHESALQALRVLHAGTGNVSFGARARRLIMATAHDRVPLEHDAACLCDADLSILGASEEAFDHYEQLVREEWAHVPEELFRPARCTIMKRFADRPWIFMTLYGRERWERPAMANLKRSLAKLAEAT
jgi:predicted metal-dependent HD superfamily phosphohydrolase